MASFADLLLNRPVPLPKGRKRNVSFEESPKKIGGSPEVLAMIWNNHLTVVHKCVRDGIETANEIVDETGVARTTVVRALNELINTNKIHSIKLYNKLYYAPIGRQPLAKAATKSKRAAILIAALKKRGGAATTLQLQVDTGLADTCIGMWMRRLVGEGTIVNAAGKKPAIWKVVE